MQNLDEVIAALTLAPSKFGSNQHYMFAKTVYSRTLPVPKRKSIYFLNVKIITLNYGAHANRWRPCSQGLPLLPVARSRDTAATSFGI
jgi:hypothetical protein